MRYALTAVLSASVAFTGASFAQAADLEVTHWWTSGGEAAAVKILAEQFDKLGGDKWVDGAIGGSGSAARPIIVSRILGGNPMGATQLNHGRQAEELVQAGLMTDLTELAQKEGWADFIRPKSLLDSCTFEGKIYCVPVNIHSWEWMWTNPNVYKEAGLEPPTNWNEFVAVAPKLKEKGITPLATGDGFQVNGIFTVLTAAIGGKELYLKVNKDKDAEAARGPEMKKVLQAFADARSLADPGYVGRSWNEATNMVMTGKAGGQIMGDWAQGEFSTAGKVAGKDYDCLPGLGDHALLDTGGDAFYFPKNSNADVTKAQMKLASMMVSKQTQVAFNLAKGSLPVRGDIDMATANECMKKGIEILKNPDNIIPSTDQLRAPDTQGQVEALAAEFFSNPDMSVEDMQERYAEIVETAQ
ncbi:carbohydrate ABC transporter substrate-binding protein [Phyllobacterium salinisoli]|uniref:Probable sugar-binding periplasmic protein n=1 Tax=Phyllobacterium salinisoli TaxID=1899321 RepID=A0A368K2P5_9HYPH|nr:ABC transporter substrate-binding protein [Phyllobacterium salinisoli]RCS22250.1 carbohydrate ABC transporter substrate-binding protein [Phyllobacterium salinisoli]